MNRSKLEALLDKLPRMMRPFNHKEFVGPKNPTGFSQSMLALQALASALENPCGKLSIFSSPLTDISAFLVWCKNAPDGFVTVGGVCCRLQQIRRDARSLQIFWIPSSTALRTASVFLLTAPSAFPFTACACARDL